MIALVALMRHASNRAREYLMLAKPKMASNPLETDCRESTISLSSANYLILSAILACSPVSFMAAPEPLRMSDGEMVSPLWVQTKPLFLSPMKSTSISAIDECTSISRLELPLFNRSDREERRLLCRCDEQSLRKADYSSRWSSIRKR